jgi:hypothetical protein
MKVAMISLVWHQLSQVTKAKVDKKNDIKLKTFCTAQKTSNKVKAN